MEKTALILIVFTNIFLVIILGILAFLVYRLVKHNKSGENQAHFHPGVIKRMKEVEKFNLKSTDNFCPNHPDEMGEASCAICDHVFCKLCIKPFRNLHFCVDHLKVVMNNEWSEILTIKTSTADPENGVKLYDLKKEFFQAEGIPTYIETHYKINVDQDYIETYLVLFGLTQQAAALKQKFHAH